MERVTADGLAVRIHRGGAGEPLLYLHSGFSEAGATPFVTALHERHAVLAPELPGFGGSDVPRWHRVEDAVFFLRTLLDEVGWTDGHVVGSSLGGWLAAELAVWFPERVRSLVLFDPVGIKVDGAPLTDIFMTSRERMIEGLFARLPDDLPAALGDALSGSDNDLLLHFYKAMEATARIGWNPYLADPQLLDRLGRCRVPATVVRGEADGVVPPAYAEAFAAALGTTVTAIPGAGHLPVIEAPEAAAHVVLDALDAVGSA